MLIVGKCHEIENRGDLGLRIVAGQVDPLVTSSAGSYNGPKVDESAQKVDEIHLFWLKSG